MIIPQQLIQEVDRLVTDKSLILRVDETVPGLLLKATKNVVVLRIQLNLILVQVVEQIVGSQDLGNLHKLVRVAVAMEKRLLAENHRGKHGTKAPHVQAVVVFLEID